MAHYHLIGIGGTGLSAIARVLFERGDTVSGSDMLLSPLAQGLIDLGIPVVIGHNENNVSGADIVIRSSAIPDSNPEVKAALAAGLDGQTDCTIGLGVPTPSWGAAVASGIAALKDMGGGTITYSDADITLVALDTTAPATFDRVVGELEEALPDVFSLHSVLPEPVSIDGTGEGAGPPEFVATRSPEGQVQLRGRVTDERTRAAVDSYAQARFGSTSVYAATRLDEELPQGWPLDSCTSGLFLALKVLGVGVILVGNLFVIGRKQTAKSNQRVTD